MTTPDPKNLHGTTVEVIASAVKALRACTADLTAHGVARIHPAIARDGIDVAVVAELSRDGRSVEDTVSYCVRSETPVTPSTPFMIKFNSTCCN